MPIGSAPSGESREIACDESGYEGENLVGGETDVFAHAGVHLSTASAAHCITELRRRIRSPALEYKANHLLREKHRPVLEWFLGPDGPIHGHAHVHLVDKTYFLVGRIVDLLVGASPDRALALYRAGRSTLPREDWAAVLASSNNLLRIRNRQGAQGGADSFLAAVDALHAGASGEAARVLEGLRAARPRAESLRAQLLDGSALDLLVPAIVRTVAHWGEDGAVPVSLVHDRQTALTHERITQIRTLLGEPRGRLRDVRLADSRSDPRIQVADFLAGVARKVASYELDGRGDAGLVALLRPYVDPSSIWGDDRSWARLAPDARRVPTADFR